MPRPDLDINANMAVVQPYLPMLAGAIRRGFEKYQSIDNYSALAKAAHDNAAAAKNVHRHILEEITVDIAGLGGLALINARGLMVLNIHDRALLRFKKMDEEGRSASYPTEQARKFDQQLPLPNLPPAAARLTFGYEPDLAFSTIVRVLTACPLGPRTHWCAQVVEDHDGIVSWVDITPRRIPGTEPFEHYGTGDV
jgi:hypothetical protein